MTEQTRLEMTVEQFVVAVSRENDRLRSEIEWHEEENHRLRHALHQIAGKVSQTDKSFDGDMASDIARTALREGK